MRSCIPLFLIAALGAADAVPPNDDGVLSLGTLAAELRREREQERQQHQVDIYKERQKQADLIAQLADRDARLVQAERAAASATAAADERLNRAVAAARAIERAQWEQRVAAIIEELRATKVPQIEQLDQVRAAAAAQVLRATGSASAAVQAASQRADAADVRAATATQQLSAVQRELEVQRQLASERTALQQTIEKQDTEIRDLRRRLTLLWDVYNAKTSRSTSPDDR
jgi:hypothetical protein